MDTSKFDKKNTKVTAHRGVSGLETENTAAAFIAAGQRSYYGVETDIHFTKDGYYICCHDSNLERVSGKSIVIEETKLSVLEDICLYERGTTEERSYLRIPHLTDYIRICKKYGKVCVAEIKGLMPREHLENIVKIFDGEDMLENTIFIAFDFGNLVILRDLLPEQKLQFLTGKIDDKLVEELKKYRMDLDVYHEALTEENIKMLHENGIEINCWTVDNTERAEQLAAWGVDHITSNILE